MENNQNRKFVIKKVPLDTFINLLNNLYVNGADYVDLHAEQDDEKRQDNVTVSVPIEYMNEGAKDAIDMENMENIENIIPPPGLSEEQMQQEEDEDRDYTDEEIKNIMKNGF